LAHIEDLIAKIQDPVLRADLETEVKKVKERRDWGLVFERHRPEMTRLLDAPFRAGNAVWERKSATPRRFRVRAVEGDELVVVAEPRNTVAPADTPEEHISRADVLFEKEFTEAVFPALEHTGSVRHGPDDRPAHIVVCGENFHAIGSLLVAMEGKVDCLYLDPPYNTGDKDWSYDNDFVDKSDTFRPSKWLAFMERRLKIGARLLKSDGVMVVTIDEKEVHHLGMLLEQMFPEAKIQMATIVINPKGSSRAEELARVEEYAFFVRFGRAGVPQGIDRMLGEERKKPASPWLSMLRRGTHSTRNDRPQMFYPVLIDPVEDRVVGIGAVMPEGDPAPGEAIEGWRAAWPIRTDGSWGYWQNGPGKARQLLASGYLKLGTYDPKRKTWAILYLNEKPRKQIEAGQLVVTGHDDQGAVVLVRNEEDLPREPVKTVWHRNRHNASSYGTDLLSDFLGQRQIFSFPKSLYAVRDTIDLLTWNNPSAVICDFFGGSGTTLHATALLNAEDVGRRQCVLVTNNEVDAEQTVLLNADDVFRGDPEFEAHGIYDRATRPRITAAITGERPDGKPVEGTYQDSEREFAEGFEENVEFFRLRYLDPMLVEMGRSFADLHPLLWLAAGGVGRIETLDPAARFAVPDGSPYAVLFHPAGVPGLLAALKNRTDVTRVFIAAHSDSSFTELASVMPVGVQTVHFQQKFLDTLRGAVL
jgi:adenine-specific DNA-methyltransferase